MPNQHTKLLMNIYETLLQEYGWRKWWHKKSRFEIILGAVLVQNTNWNNAAIALIQLKIAKLMKPQALVDVPLRDLKIYIKSAGLFNQKAKYIKAVATYFNTHSLSSLNKLDTATLRRELLSVRGIGHETADVILLYVFKRPVFIADNYAYKLLMTHGLIKKKLPYMKLQTIFHEALEHNTKLFSEYHALIVHHGKMTKSPLSRQSKKPRGKHF